MSRYKKILVIRLGAFGDVVLSFATMAAIRSHHADAHITFLTTPPFAGIMQKSPYFDSILPVSRWPWHDFRAWYGFSRDLRAARYDCVYDLQRNDRTGIFRLLAPPHLHKKWYGSDPLPYKNNNEALDTVDIGKFPIPDISWLDADVSRFGITSPFVLLVPGCSPQHPQKRWPAEHYAALAWELKGNGYTPVVLGTAAEADIIRKLNEAVPGIHDLGGKTSFMDIAALARQASGAVGNDTGPMHLIAISGCPSVSLFSGYSNPDQSAPKGRSVTVLQQPCINDIEVAAVLQAVLSKAHAINY